MSKSKQDPTRQDRTKRAHRDPSPEREAEREKSWRPTDENFEDSDGAVDQEMEFDTGKYDAPRNR
jgi:hypothetical protein